MKFRMLLSALLLATGLVFVAGCGKNSASPAGANAGNAAAADPKTVVENDTLAKEMNFKYTSTMNVNDNYVVVCGYGDIKGKGHKQVGFHLKKEGGQWKVADWEDNWAPKDRLK